MTARTLATRVAAVLAVGTLLTAGVAHAAAVAHLAWDDCGANGTSLKTFACSTNSGSQLLVVSFVPPGGITTFNALEARIQIATFDGTLPDWWRLDTGGCRAGALGANLDLAASPGHCADAYAGAGAGGANASPSTFGEIDLVAARATATALDSTLEYYAGGVVLLNVKTSGAGSCSGCSQPRGIYLRSLRLYQSTSTFDYALDYRGSGEVPAYVNWQCDGQPVLQLDAMYGWFLTGWDFPGCATPTRSTSWGQIKSLYR